MGDDAERTDEAAGIGGESQVERGDEKSDRESEETH